MFKFSTVLLASLVACADMPTTEPEPVLGCDYTADRGGFNASFVQLVVTGDCDGEADVWTTVSTADGAAQWTTDYSVHCPFDIRLAVGPIPGGASGDIVTHLSIVPDEDKPRECVHQPLK